MKCPKCKSETPALFDDDRCPRCSKIYHPSAEKIPWREISERNKPATKIVSTSVLYRGMPFTFKELEMLTGLRAATLRNRITQLGWGVEMAMQQPVNQSLTPLPGRASFPTKKSVECTSESRIKISSALRVRSGFPPLMYKGRPTTWVELSLISGIRAHTIRTRVVRLGWTVRRAVSTTADRRATKPPEKKLSGGRHSSGQFQRLNETEERS